MILRLDLYHSSYLITAISYLHLPFFSPITCYLLIISHLRLISVTISNTYRPRNLLTFKYRSIIFCLHLLSYSVTNPYYLVLVIRIISNLPHSGHLHELILILFQHLNQLTNFSYAIPLIMGPILHISHSSTN